MDNLIKYDEVILFPHKCDYCYKKLIGFAGETVADFKERRFHRICELKGLREELYDHEMWTRKARETQRLRK